MFREQRPLQAVGGTATGHRIDAQRTTPVDLCPTVARDGVPDLNRLELRICDLVQIRPSLLAITTLLELRVLNLARHPHQLDPLHSSNLSPDELAELADSNDAAARRQPSMRICTMAWCSVLTTAGFGPRLKASRPCGRARTACSACRCPSVSCREAIRRCAGGTPRPRASTPNFMWQAPCSSGRFSTIRAPLWDDHGQSPVHQGHAHPPPAADGEQPSASGGGKEPAACWSSRRAGGGPLADRAAQASVRRSRTRGCCVSSSSVIPLLWKVGMERAPAKRSSN